MATKKQTRNDDDTGAEVARVQRRVMRQCPKCEHAPHESFKCGEGERFTCTCLFHFGERVHPHECDRCGASFDCDGIRVDDCEVWCGRCNDLIRDAGDDYKSEMADVQIERDNKDLVRHYNESGA